jgi:hypothetical protein
MHTSDQRLAAFLAGELDPDAARAVDEHLLTCEDCWHNVGAARLGRRAAEQLRQPAPPDLADRIRLAVELAPTPAHPKRSPHRRGRWAVVASSAAALIAAILLAVLAVPSHPRQHDPAVITALVRLAAQPAPASPSTAQANVAGQTIQLRYYPIAGHTAIIATSNETFPMPRDSRAPPGSAMAWTATRAPITLDCPHARVILAGPVPAGALTTLAQRLHLY